MTLREILEAVKKLILDDDFSETELIDKVNEGLYYIAGGGDLNPSYWLAPLPDLYKSGTVDTSTSNPYVSLPSDYQRGLFKIVDSSGQNVKIYHSFNKFLNVYPALNEGGSVAEAAVKGRTLYYQGKPASAATLTLHYYRYPATLASDSDIPEGIPAHLHRRLLVYYVAAEVFGEIEDALEGGSTNEKKWAQKFAQAMGELRKFVGPEDREAYNVEDDDSLYISDY